MCALMPSSHCGLPGSTTELPGGSSSSASQLSLVNGARAGEKWTIGHTSTAAVLRGRDVTGERQRLVEVLRLEDVVAARHLGALGERAVGDGRGVGSAGDPHAGRRRLQRVARRIAEAALAWKSW